MGFQTDLLTYQLATFKVENQLTRVCLPQLGFRLPAAAQLLTLPPIFQPANLLPFLP